MMKRSYKRLLERVLEINTKRALPIRCEKNYNVIRFESPNGAIAYGSGYSTKEAHAVLDGIEIALNIAEGRR